MQKINLQKNKGFTIIETMIAISIFLVVVTVGMGSLLNTTLLHRKSQDMRSIMDNLSFIMEDMSKNLRIGYSFHCGNDLLNLGNPLSCVNGKVIAFKSVLGDQWVYKIESLDGGVTYNLSKSVNGGATWTQLNPSEINFGGSSSFSVTGAEAPPGNTLQPFTTIRLNGSITSENNVVTPFSLQTSISQRLVDI